MEIHISVSTVGCKLADTDDAQGKNNSPVAVLNNYFPDVGVNILPRNN